MSQDELAQINGIEPKVLLKEGESQTVKSASISNVAYSVKRTFDHYYCTCPAWRNQGGVPVNARTCKHLRILLGDKYEDARLELKNPSKSRSPKANSAHKPPSKGRSKPTSKRTRKDDDNDDDHDNPRKSKRPRVTPSPSKRRRRNSGDDADQGEMNQDEDDENYVEIPCTGGVPELLLANKWDIENGPDPTGWWISEKLDGVRMYYDGKRMISRLGNPFTPPQWFLDKLPKEMTLDGELFAGRGKFQSTVSIVKTVNSPYWKDITFQIFDVPSLGDRPFEERVKFLKRNFGPGGKYEWDQVKLVEQEAAKNRQHVLNKLKEVESLGGEGLMLRKPKSQYEGRRSDTLLKVKTFYDAEAVVLGYFEGSGKNKGRTGALKCKMASGKIFKVGSGLTDKQREKPPKIGSIITYRFQEITKEGAPRFPTFVGIAIDKKKPKDAELPEHRKGANKSDDA